MVKKNLYNNFSSRFRKKRTFFIVKFTEEIQSGNLVQLSGFSMALQQTSIHYNKVIAYPHYYLCNYLPLSTGRDTLSYSLLKFKRAQQPDLNGWIDCSLEMLGAAGIAPGTTIIRALHHDETAIREDKPVALDLLGKALAERFHGFYRPTLLFKSRRAREIRKLGREEREAELKGIY